MAEHCRWSHSAGVGVGKVLVSTTTCARHWHHTVVLGADACGIVNLGDENVSFQDNANTFYVGNCDILQTTIFEVSMSFVAVAAGRVSVSFGQIK